MTLTLMTDLDLKDQRVLIREDLNVPIVNGKITSPARLKAALPTIRHALEQGAQVILMSHLGRPSEGEFSEEFSLAPVADYLERLLGEQVVLINDWESELGSNSYPLVMLENVRFNVGEKSNEDSLAKAYASLCDIFVMDAFGTAHRAQASTHGVAKYAPVVCAGPLLNKELSALEQALANPAAPIVAIVGGSKVSTKLMVLESLASAFGISSLIVCIGFLAIPPIPLRPKRSSTA